MNVRLFARTFNFDERTTRREIERAADRPAEIGVEIGGTVRRPSYRVTDPERLERALARRLGPRFIQPDTFRRVHALLELVIEAGAAPAGLSDSERAAWLAAVREDRRRVALILPNPPAP